MKKTQYKIQHGGLSFVPPCAYVGWQAEALSVGQREQLVVIQHRVQVLHPLWVHVAVEYDPLALLQLPAHVVNDPGGRREEEGGREGQRSGLGRDGLWRMGVGYAALHFSL